MGKRNKAPSSNDGKNLFEQHMQGVRRLVSDKRDPCIEGKNINPFRDRHRYDEKQPADHLSDEWETDSVAGDEFIFYAQPGLQFKYQKALRQGKIIPEDHLDLHGMTVSQARQDLIHFIDYARQMQIRCIRLVHGKGYRAGSQQPVLKNKINSWLRQHPHVIAFSSAQPRDGGTGAVYILVKTLAEVKIQKTG